MACTGNEEILSFQKSREEDEMSQAKWVCGLWISEVSEIEQVKLDA